MFKGQLYFQWKRSCRVDTLVSYWVLEEKHSVSPTDREASQGLLTNGLYCVEEIFFYEWMLNFFRCSISITWDDCVVFIFP